MSDELDPNLLRLFTDANQPLPGGEFQTEVIAQLHRQRGRLEIAQSFGFAILAALSGIAVGVIAPFKVRSGYIGVMAASAAALTLWITLQAP
jgi:hypothetical protein